jgi:hypothetical protein
MFICPGAVSIGGARLAAAAIELGPGGSYGGASSVSRGLAKQDDEAPVTS